jgi:hypothetical protein
MHHTVHKTGLMECYRSRTSRNIRVSHHWSARGGGGIEMTADLQLQKKINFKKNLHTLLLIYICPGQEGQ